MFPLAQPCRNEFGSDLTTCIGGDVCCYRRKERNQIADIFGSRRRTPLQSRRGPAPPAWGICSPFLRYNLLVSSVRTCVVSFRDIEGMQHAVEVNAASLYEAAVLGLKAFRSSSFAEHSLPGTNTKLKVTVRSKEASHEIAVRVVETWLRGQGKSPREQALKVRLRGVVRGVVS